VRLVSELFFPDEPLHRWIVVVRTDPLDVGAEELRIDKCDEKELVVLGVCFAGYGGMIAEDMRFIIVMSRMRR